MVLVCNALKQCDCRIYTNFFLVYLIQNYYTLDVLFKRVCGYCCMYKHNYNRGMRLLMKERLEKRTLPAHALACCGLGHSLIIVVVVGVCTSTTSGSWGAWRNNTHTNDDDYDEAVAEAAVAAVVIRIRPWKARLIAALWRHQ